jgi:hypothetical protein
MKATLKPTFTENYIFILSDENPENHYMFKKENNTVSSGETIKVTEITLLAHLPLNHSCLLDGIPLLPELPNNTIGKPTLFECEIENSELIKNKTDDGNIEIQGEWVYLNNN